MIFQENIILKTILENNSKILQSLPLSILKARPVWLTLDLRRAPRQTDRSHRVKTSRPGKRGRRH